MEEDNNVAEPEQGDIVKAIQSGIMESILPHLEQLCKRIEKLETRSTTREEEASLFMVETPTSKFGTRPLRRSQTVRKGDSSDEESDGSASDNGPKKGFQRRKSIIEEDLVKSRSKGQTQFLQTLPDYTHIHLKRATVKDFDKFL